MTTPVLAAGDALSQRPLILATVGGVVLGVAYTLSPLTIWAAAGVLFLGRSLVRDIGPEERRVIIAIFIAAVVLRLLVLAGLFLSIDHAVTPFGSLFGDEEYFKRRSMWMRSMAVGVNVSAADRTYALDEYSETSYLYLLAFIQVLVGDAPYGVHVFSMLAYLAGAVWLFRLSRRIFGPAPAALTLFGVLFLPTLFFWSISALRESVHFLLTMAAVAGAVDLATRERWRHKVLGLVLVVVALYALRDLREGSRTVMLAALLAGGLASVAVTGWRRLVLTVAVSAAAAALVLTRPAVQDRMMDALRTAALRHQGHAFTPGIHYKVLEPRFYRDRSLTVMRDMTWDEAGRYAIRALGAAVVVPMPWQAETRMLQAYLPEHAVWLLLVLLFPIGVWAAARRQAAAAFIMAAYVVAMFAGIALTSGNVGTLVRHRGVVLPFVMCLGAVAVCHLLSQPRAKDLADGAD